MITNTPPSITKLRKNPTPFDVVLVSGDYWADHPHSGIGVIARVLDSLGLSVGICEKPDWHTTRDIKKFGLPRLFYGVSSGAIDSLLVNYTPLKKPRSLDPYRPYKSGIPDRAVIVYSNLIKRAQKELIEEFLKNSVEPRPIILGGVEASLRRVSHYDYWDNKVRKSILFDTKADLLVFGPGEAQVKIIVDRLRKKQTLHAIPGTCEILKESEVKTLKDTLTSPSPSLSQDAFRKIISEYASSLSPIEELPEHSQVIKDKILFCKMSLQLSNEKTLIQKVDSRYLVQYRMYPYSSKDLDELYKLPFTYFVPDKFKEFKMAKFSIMTHRGCIGKCNFCSIALHQGNKIISRSAESILEEIRKMTKMDDFRGHIYDIGGASANMYGMDCPAHRNCTKDCLSCRSLDRSHKKVTSLLIQSRAIEGVKKTFVRSGIRYDLAIDADEYLEELITHHVSGSLKIAPEHVVPKVCKLMNKPYKRLDEFIEKFYRFSRKAGKKQFLKFYFMTAHPGSTIKDAWKLRRKIEQLGFKSTESIQIFTPTPMSLSTCMYYTGLDPYSLKKIYVPYTYHEKKEQKRILYPSYKSPPK